MCDKAAEQGRQWLSVQDDTFVIEHRILIVEINSVTQHLLIAFLLLRIAFKYFCPNGL